jgi:hypothetical protein
MLDRIKLLQGFWGEDLEKTRVYVGIPTAGNPELHFIEPFLKVYKWLLDNNYAVHVGIIATSMITSNRAQIVEEAIRSEADYILWMDDDMLVMPEAVDYLFKAVKDNKDVQIVGANYPTRGSPHYFVARYKDRGDRVATTVMSKGLTQVDFIGLGLVLMSTKVVKGLTRPWFRMDEYYGEDVYFLDKIADKYGVRPYISHDASKALAHIGKKFVTYADGRARESSNTFIRDPTEDEVFGDLDEQPDEEHQELKHIRSKIPNE